MVFDTCKRPDKIKQSNVKGGSIMSVDKFIDEANEILRNPASRVFVESCVLSREGEGDYLKYNLDTKEGRKAWKDAAPKGVERFVIEDGEPWARQYGEHLFELALAELAPEW